jgi:hypothetical protein
MTYAGLGSILFRFVGVIMIGAVLVLMIPTIALGGPAYPRGALFFWVGVLLVPGAVLIFVSKPLGRILAAGLD